MADVRAFDEIVLGDAPRLSVRVWHGTGTPFLLVHGLSHNLEVWTPLVAHLPHDAHVVAIDLRNHGHSGPSSDHSYDGYATDLLSGALAADRPVVVGHSWGARVALYAASERPEAFRCVVALDQALWDHDPPRRYLDGSIDCEALSVPILSDIDKDATIHEARAWGPWAAVVWRSFRRCRDGWVQRPTPPDICGLTVAEAKAQPVEQRYGSITCPVMFVFAADEDDFSFAPSRGRPANVAALAQAIPGGRIEWLDGDHGFHVEQPAALAGLLLDFVVSTTEHA